jgi:hypothetical protein
MEALNPQEDESHGSTEEVPGGASGASGPARGGSSPRSEHQSWRTTSDCEQLSINPETLRNWVQQAEIDAGDRPGVTTDDAARIAELEREVRELRRANQISRSASAFFAAELDRPSSR